MSELAPWISSGRTITYGFWPADVRDERSVLCLGDLLSDPDGETLFLESVPRDGRDRLWPDDRCLRPPELGISGRRRFNRSRQRASRLRGGRRRTTP